MLFPLLALVTGLLLSRYLDPNAVWLCLPLAILLGVARRRLALLAILLLGAGLRSIEPPSPPEVPAEASRVVCKLLRRPEWRGLGVYLDVELLSVDERPYRGRARITEFLDDPELLKMFNALDLGTADRLEILVKLHRPVSYRNPGVFNFRRYLERQGIYWTGTIRNPRLITVLQRGWWGWHSVDHVQTWIETKLRRQFESDRTAGGLVLGMVLGRKHELTASVERQFQAGGLYHMVVVSGFNLAVVGGVAALIARFVVGKRATRLLIIILAVLGYSLLVGGQTPVLRAALMACILVAGKALDRDYSLLNSACLAAFILLPAAPPSIEDSSFQMTFAAVFALACLGIPLARWALSGLHQKLRHFDNVELDGWLPPDIADWRVARRMWCELHGLPNVAVTLPWRLLQFTVEALILSLAVEVVFAYFMVESFHRLALIAPLLNVPGGVFAGAVTSLGLLMIALPDAFGFPAMWIIQKLVRGLMWSLETGTKLPFASLRTPSAPVWIWCLYASALALLVWSIRKRNLWILGVSLAGVAGLQAAMILADFSPAPPTAVTATFLDVGQGDSTLIEFPDGRRMLIDGGGVAAGRFLGLRDESTFSIGEDVLSPYLFSRGIRNLDVVVLTHAHNDHLDGLSDILANFKVGQLWLGRNPMIPAYRELIEQAQAAAIPLRLISAPDRLEPGITVLHPPKQWRVRKSAENNDSVVLLLQSGPRTALFTGDMELPLPGLPAFVNVFKFPHHGSRGVRMRIRSDVRVISVGGNNPFGHPHPSSLPALRTDVLGAIEVRLDAPHPAVRLVGF